MIHSDLTHNLVHGEMSSELVSKKKKILFLASNRFAK